LDGILFGAAQPIWKVGVEKDFCLCRESNSDVQPVAHRYLDLGILPPSLLITEMGLSHLRSSFLGRHSSRPFLDLNLFKEISPPELSEDYSRNLKQFGDIL
jgi:hypothetical protein